ncbi:WhiB family transcriptional regulator [Kitasatospora sp. NPDC053057]|uniref:WhiB family transcriptional regulator n=1 Tax=Kitasatospora sp. NPDC053057 TaxID=3364062 RepID=UPI0037CC2711
MADLSRLPEAPEHDRDPERDPERDPRPEGACRTVDGAIPFLAALAAPEQHGVAAREQEEAAKAVCVGCAVRVECRRRALAVREPYGVLGGLTAEERRALFTSDPVPRAA